MTIHYKFRGFVEDINEKSFFARLIDQDGKELAAMFDIKNDKIIHKERLQKGAYFTWIINKKEGKKAENTVTFDTKIWTKKELEQAKKRAKELKKKIGW